MALTAYRIERHDGSIDGLGDELLFRLEQDAWTAAETAFGLDRASVEHGIESWLRVVPVEVADDDPRLQSVADAFAAHQAADPHCTCPDCIVDHFEGGDDGAS